MTSTKEEEGEQGTTPEQEPDQQEPKSERPSIEVRGVRSWLADRTGWPHLVSLLEHHRVPRHGFVFYVGGITLFLFLTQVATGILLLLYYQPDPEQAFQSVQRITGGDIPYGNLVRNVHAWTADLFVLTLFAHMFTVLVRRSFRPPHEMSWISGIFALLIGIGLAFTGSILPWNEAAYANASVGSDLARYVPLIGEWLMRFLRGGQEVGAGTLGHAFGFHVAALPATLTSLVAMHLFLLSRKPAARTDASTPTIPLYPDFLVRQGVALTGVTVLIMTLATFFDRQVGALADPTLSPAGARPPWYFLPIHQIVRSAPKELLGIDGPRFLVGMVCVLGLVVVALPFVDTRGSKITAYAAWALLIVLLVLSASALT